MNKEDLFAKEHTLHLEAERLFHETELMSLLESLGGITMTGSFTTGLMVKPDIDLTIQHPEPFVQVAIDMLPRLFAELKPFKVSIADFSKRDPNNRSYFLGILMKFNEQEWQIDANVGLPGPIRSNPPELDDWLRAMTDKQRSIILRLKDYLIRHRRYAGARSQPPYTFRSVHLYEAILRGGATTIDELEAYFKNKPFSISSV